MEGSELYAAGKRAFAAFQPGGNKIKPEPLAMELELLLSKGSMTVQQFQKYFERRWEVRLLHSCVTDSCVTDSCATTMPSQTVEAARVAV